MKHNYHEGPDCCQQKQWYRRIKLHDNISTNINEDDSYVDSQPFSNVWRPMHSRIISKQDISTVKLPEGAQRKLTMAFEIWNKTSCRCPKEIIYKDTQHRLYGIQDAEVYNFTPLSSLNMEHGEELYFTAEKFEKTWLRH